MIQVFKKLLGIILPFETKKFIKNTLFSLKLKKVRYLQGKALKRVRKKTRIKVAFFLIHESVWKYAGIYKLMVQDERFDPVIIVCPYIVMGEEVMFRDMNQAYNAFLEKGYKVIKTFNEETRIWLDVKKELMPDMVFFTNPWKLTRPEYYILNFLDTLTCYVPYFFHVTCHLERNYKGAVQNLAWRVFYETQIHYNFAKRYSINKASNVIISGYPALDRFILHSENIIDPWLQKDNNRKRIIWAPHHTIEGQDAGLSYSNFEKYAHFFIQLANLYCSKLKFTFKPHPLLKAKLYINQNWGKIKTDNYFNKWEELENGQLVEGEYVDLFINSDALIHDSGSFTVEYLATGKPCLYTLHDSNVNERLNDFGKMALNHHYTAKNEEEIIHFIEDVVISGKDTMKDIRNSFINQYLLPPHNKSASENIFNELVNSIKPII